MSLKIYHNPRCTKSRETLKLIEGKGKSPEIIEYLKSPPTQKELKSILTQLNMKPEQILRKKESVYKEKFAGKELTDAQWIKAIVENPVLMERPIVVSEKGAAIGRPPENVLEVL